MLFKTIAEFGVLDTNTNFATFSKYIQDAQDKYILKVLGQDQLTALDTAYNANTLSAEQTALLAKVQPALRNLALYIALPKMNLRLNNLGVMKSESEDYSSANGGEIYFARIQYLLDGFAALDTLYEFLYANSADYPLWVASSSYTQFKKSFIRSAAEFNRHVNISNSRWLLVQMLQNMELVETLRIRAAIGDAFFTDLKTRFITDDLETEEETFLFGDEATGFTGLVKPIALYTYADSLTDPAVREVIRITNATTADDLGSKGNEYKQEYAALASRKEAEADALMTALRRHLNATASATVFPIYFASTYYKDPATSSATKLPNYNNDTSETSFVMI